MSFNIHCSTYIPSSGVAFYRMKSVTDMLAYQNLGKEAYIESPMPMRDSVILDSAKSYRVQRLCTESTVSWLKTIASYKHRNSKLKLIYDFDDMMDYSQIPQYNIHRNCYIETDSYIKEAMNLVDTITTTNDTLVNFYSEKYSISKDKFIVIPNYIPKYMFSNKRTPDDILRTLTNKKPRIVFCGGREHVNENKNSAAPVDDLYHIRKWIRNNADRFQFVFVGCTIPLYLKDISSKFLISGGVNILSYPSFRQSIGSSLYVQPLQNNLFNKCKSTIKMTEAWAENVPVLVQGLDNYSEFDNECTFADVDELEYKVETLFSNHDLYVDTVFNNYEKMNTRKLWLEGNIFKWHEVING